MPMPMLMTRRPAPVSGSGGRAYSSSIRVRTTTRAMPKVLLKATSDSKDVSNDVSKDSKDDKKQPINLNTCIEFVSWVQEEQKKIQQDRNERIAAAQDSLRAVVKQERDTMIRLIKEIREMRGNIVEKAEKDKDNK